MDGIQMSSTQTSSELPSIRRHQDSKKT